MKTTLISLAFAGFVAAQEIPADIPQCALGCLGTVLPDVGCESATDFACACENLTEIMGTAAECFLTECDSDELAAAQSAAQEACAAMGTMSSVNPTPTATTTVMGTIIDPTTTPSVSVSTSVSTVTTPATTPGSSDTTTSTESDDATGTESSAPTTTDPDGGVGKPLAGAGLALLAALAAL